MSSQLLTQSLDSDNQLIDISINKQLISVSKHLIIKFVPKLLENNLNLENYIEMNDCDFVSFNTLINEMNINFNSNDFINSLINSIELSIDLKCDSMTQLLANNLIDLINNSNVLQIYSKLFNKQIVYNNNYYYKNLIEECLHFIDLNALNVLNSSQWKEMSDKLLISIIIRDTFYSPEIDIFKAIHQWIQFKDRSIHSNYGFSQEVISQEVLSYLRLHLISDRQFHKIIRPTKLITEKAFNKAIKMRNQLINNGLFVERAKILEQKSKTINCFKLINANPVITQNSLKDMISISTEVDVFSPITIDLQDRYKINYISFTLSKSSQDLRRYSYYIIGSVDGIKWNFIIDFREYVCASKQLISFSPIVIRFISIYNYIQTRNRLPVINFDCGFAYDSVFTTNSGTLVFNRLLFPNMFSYCISVFRRNDTTIRQYYPVYNISDKKPLLHYIGSGRVGISFNQPMFINVFQFYLWNKDKRFYRYFVQISKNLVDWEMVCDYRKNWRSGLQRIEILRNVISIRIVGTDVHPNRINDTLNGEQEFRIIHLDFPQ